MAGSSRPKAISPPPVGSWTARAPSIPLASILNRTQQAAEKYLKGFLAFYDELIPHSHNLEELALLCRAKCPTLNLDHVDVTELTPFAVEMRYDFEFWPSRSTAQDALDLALEVRRTVLALIPSNAKP